MSLDGPISGLTQEQTTALEERIDRAVAKAPPLTDEQLARLRELLPPPRPHADVA